MIRMATVADIPRLKELWEEGFRDPLNYLDFFYSRVAAPSYTYLSEEGEGIVAMLTMLVLRRNDRGSDGISLFGAFWDVDRSLFWGGFLTLLLFTFPVLPVLAFLEWRIRLLCVEYDYALSDNTFSVWRIGGNRRVFYLAFDLNDLTFCKAYDSLSESELGRMKKALFACCNASDPRLTLVEANNVQIRKQIKDAAILLEPNEEIAKVLCAALRRNGR